MDDFLDFGDHLDQFGDEYENINQCDGPSSEDAELDHAGKRIPQLAGMDLIDTDLALGGYTAETSMTKGSGAWSGLRDSFSPFTAKIASGNSISRTIDDPGNIAVSWPGPLHDKSTMKVPMMHDPSLSVQSPPLPHISSFTMSQIAPPSLPEERNRSTTTPSLCSDYLRDDDMTTGDVDSAAQPPRKRRASETVRKTGKSGRGGHKRSSSIAFSHPKPTGSGLPTVTLEGPDVNESGDPDVARRQDRLMRNRAAALASRERKREHVTKLENCVQDLELQKDEMTLRMTRMSNEIGRLRKLLNDNGVDDLDAAIDFDFKVNDTPSLETMMACSPVCEELEVKSRIAAINKVRAAPTGFSPRGALKKSEIMANHERAEAHLRKLTMRQENTSRDGSTESEDPDDSISSALGDTETRASSISAC